MYTVEQIDSIDTSVFNAMYANDQERLAAYVGFDDVDRYRQPFEYTDQHTLLFKVSDANAVKAYVVGIADDDDVRIINMITAGAETISQFVEPSATLLKSLGYADVIFYTYTNVSTYDYIKNNLNRDDVYQYVSEEMIGDVCHIKLNLL